ncbi:MAG: FkbM family methyltransferase [Armatimonadetes bacterium]|nr:FkbM family methyltransferase [Armatimonadota bacterium]
MTEDTGGAREGFHPAGGRKEATGTARSSAATMNLRGVDDWLSRKLAAVRRVVREHGAREAAAIVFRYGRLWWGVLVYALAGCVRIAGLRFRLEGPCFPLWRRSGYWFRDYEHVEMEAVRRWLRRDLPVLELGGGLGGVACIIDRLMDEPARHVVVEANPAMWDLLEANRRRNDARFTVVRAALGYGGPEVTFHRHPSYFEVGSLQPGPEETVSVPATTVAALLAEHDLGVCNLVADIEGGEVELVEREGALLAERVAVLELHPHLVGERPIAALLRRLVRLGFRIVGHRFHGPALVVSLVNLRRWPPVSHRPCRAVEEPAGPEPGTLLEHVGCDEEVKDPAKGGRAAARLVGMLRAGGRLAATLPLGYNPHLDAWLLGGEHPFGDVRYLCRRWLNRWSECTAAEAAEAPYDFRRSRAGALALATATRAEG